MNRFVPRVVIVCQLRIAQLSSTESRTAGVDLEMGTLLGIVSREVVHGSL
jgi:hypothetical protein